MVFGRILFVRFFQYTQILCEFRADVQKRIHLRNQCFPKLFGQWLLRERSGGKLRDRKHRQKQKGTGETLQRYLPQRSSYRQAGDRRQEMGGPPAARFHLLQYVPGHTDWCTPGNRLRPEAPQRTLSDAFIGIWQTRSVHQRAGHRVDSQLQ